MKKKQLALLIPGVTALMLSQFAYATDQEKSTAKEKSAAKEAKESARKESAVTEPTAPVLTETGAYLGIGVEALHPAFHAQLPGSLFEGQGIMVTSVVKDSPADKAGLKRHDILTGYDDQRLFSGEQLVRLVRAGKAGQEVKLQYVRASKLEAVTVKLGEEPPHIADKDHQQLDLWERRFPWISFSPLRPNGRMPRTKHRSHWDSFDSLNLQKLDGDRFRAEISYLDKDGKTHKHTFEGTREEIRKLIEEEKDLPSDERDQLLDGLNLHPQFVFPEFPTDPFGSPFEWPDPFKDF